MYMYHQQQNKWHPQRFLRAHLKLSSILAVPNLLANNNITRSYNVQVKNRV